MSRERRYDPYKNFKFLVGFAAVGAIAYRVGRKWFARTETLYPGVYVDEVPTTSKPIEGVVTSTSDPSRRRRPRGSERQTSTSSKRSDPSEL